MSRSYRDDYTEHEKRSFNAQKNNTRLSKVLYEPEDDEGMTCPNCKKFCTYIYLARNAQCYSCGHNIKLDN